VLTLYLVRHGEHAQQGRVLVGRQPVTLSGEGARRAPARAHRPGARPVRAVYASPQPRTLATAAPLARQLGLDVEIAPALDEVDFGAWTGRSFAELDPRPEWQAYNAARSLHRPPGGESLHEVQARVVRFLEMARERHAHEALVLVSHADTLRALLLHALGMPLDFVLRLEIPPGSYGELDLHAGGARLRALGVRPGSAALPG
jgi:broad specificity phosphatase PhoE